MDAISPSQRGRGSPFESEVDERMAPPNSPQSSTAMCEGVNSIKISDTEMMQNTQVGNNNKTTYYILNANHHRDGEIPRKQHEDLTTTAKADHEIYYSQLLTKKRGSPLWVPGPGRRLPIEYRQEGITIGDVGIITSLGAFNFLFNIFRPADHPINRGGVPRGFSPLSLDEFMYDIQDDTVYGPETHLASSSVQMISVNQTSGTSIVQRFQSSAKEVAILMMPHGAATQDLFNIQEICDTISPNAEEWYKYAKDTRGRDVKNGDIRVVVGTDKVSSWGIAASACDVGQTTSFVFKHDPIHTYKWECTGGSGRVGPSKSEISDLIQNDIIPQNQCVFVRTINFTFSGEMWKNFPSKAVVEVGPGSVSFDYRDSDSRNQGGSGHGSSGSNTSPGHQSGPMQGSSNCTQSVKFDLMELGVDHPSTALHNCLHQKFPDASMVITEDMDWVSVLGDGDVAFPEPEDLSTRILEAHELQNNSGTIRVLRRARGDAKLGPRRGMVQRLPATQPFRGEARSLGSRIPTTYLPTNQHSTLQAATDSSPSLGSFLGRQVAPNNPYLPASPRISSFGSTIRGLTRIGYIDNSRLSGHPVARKRDYERQGLMTFRDLQGAEVSGGVFLNAAGPVTIHHGVVSTTESEPLRQPPDNDDAEAINVNIHPTQNSSPTATSGSLEHSEYEIYSKYLSVKQRGLPLWEPGPPMSFPTEYRKNGVSIGDVGILDSTIGYFDVLFNIFHPANHEINEGRVPDGFVPLDWSKAQRSITRGILYDRGSCLASPSLRRTESSDFSFQTTGREGAILVMPDGALSDDLGNHKMVEKYIAAHAKSWWEYIESDDCGVQTENVIQVVVGTDKVSSWAMATFENVSIEDPIEFELKGGGTVSHAPTYQWKRISGRVGPSEEEIRDLQPLPHIPLRNQCVFIRTLNCSRT